MKANGSSLPSKGRCGGIGPFCWAAGASTDGSTSREAENILDWVAPCIARISTSPSCSPMVTTHSVCCRSAPRHSLLRFETYPPKMVTDIVPTDDGREASPKWAPRNEIDSVEGRRAGFASTPGEDQT